MDHLKIYKDNYADMTAVSNIFIDEYMKDANDAQIGRAHVWTLVT